MLRAQMAEDDLDCYIIPRTDAYLSEDISPRDERVAWLSGFTGSAGFIAVTRKKAGLFVDGRYVIQAQEETAQVFEQINWPDVRLADWLIEVLPKSARIGIDPWLHSVKEIEDLRRPLEKHGMRILAVENPIDRLWEDRPQPAQSDVFIHPLEYTGEKTSSKLERLEKDLSSKGFEYAVLTQRDSVAWAFNIRGRDLKHTPVMDAYAILSAHQSGHLLFLADHQVTPELSKHIGAKVKIRPISLFERSLKSLEGPVLVDPKNCPAKITEIFEEAQISWAKGDDPTALPRACKNAVEIAGAKNAHLRDGVAMVTFLASLSGEENLTQLSEMDLVKRLDGLRAEQKLFSSLSFDTICGSGPNGAIVHYRANEKTNRVLQGDDFLLVDSGGQYFDGTTDITRTLALGQVTREQRAAYTAVLRGMIALSCQEFPAGLTGGDLDALARAHLWHEGLDFAHGTGHGVGSYLSVHEGPQRISKTSKQPLSPGMILSNEPGYYEKDAYGIRIENLVYVVDKGALSPMGKSIYKFETLTHVPIDLRPVDLTKLRSDEKDWINAYHARTLTLLKPKVAPWVREWLTKATAPI